MIFFYGLILGLLIAGTLYTILIYKIKKKYQTDFTTKLPTFHAFLNHCKRLTKNIEYIVVTIDLDHFKQFNEISYKIGDEALRHFSIKLKETFHKNAFISRYRLGDEFIILVKSENFECFNKKLHLLNSQIVFTDSEGKNHNINFSFGFSKLELNKIELSFEKAEKALIRRKQERNLKKK